MDSDIHSKIRELIQDEFLDDAADTPGIDEDLLELGFFDSLRVVRLKVALERALGVTVAEGDITMANFRSMRTIGDLMAVKLADRPL